ncbi:TonB-dependent receptor plug domain-containing protein [Agaribacterium haliotis]|uniref:TonB-dependent receptor plug domain-containing protein n=1 Tax=Agaribacterium haliotis TaxID=2013869 RepID=UPI00130417C0|nr:TonB-dependent receptor [Agaribacterium haliotis]
MKKSLERKKLYTAVLTSIALGSALTAFAEDEPKNTEEVYVTGSRIATTVVSETERPITVLTTQDLELQGTYDATSALRELPFNSIGSFRDSSGTSYGQIALVDLKGLGPSRTAVLINGRRVGSNPLTGTSAVDLNTIPMAAIERIEVLNDSASAIYGADAIGGVVNIILKKEYEGLTIQAGYDDPSRDDATTNRFSIVTGQQSDSGHVTFALDYYKRNPIFDADRDYSRVQVNANPNGGDPRHGVDTVGVSFYGNTGESKTTGDLFRVGDCDPSVYIPTTTPDGDVCGFGYADISMMTGGIERTSAVVDAGYKLSDNHELYIENRLTKSDTFGRFAPVAGGFTVAEDAPLNTTGEAFNLYHRFTGHGNRNDNISITEMANTLGFKGKFFTDSINYDGYVSRYQYDAMSEGDTYVIKSIIEEKVADGSYNIINPLDPSNAEAIQDTSATLVRDMSTEYTSAGFILDGRLDAITLPGGPLGWAAGLEWAEEEYTDQYDNLREAGNILGSAGNTSGADRNRSAVFGEVAIPILEQLNANVSARYDDYSDFEGQFSPQVSIKWDPIKYVGVRASWGEGFKAPNLLAMSQELAASAEGLKDLEYCKQQGISAKDCPEPQVDSHRGGNPELNAETSESFNFGILLHPMDNLDFSVDYWTVEIYDAVELLDEKDVLTLEAQGNLPPGVRVNRVPTNDGSLGKISRCIDLSPPDCGIINVYGNYSDKTVSGLDMRLAYALSTKAGEFGLSATGSRYLKYDETPVDETFHRVGTAEYPRDRLTSNLSWSKSDVTLTYTYQWIDSHKDVTDGEVTQEYAAYRRHDINAVWSATENFNLAFGVRNFTDEDPSIDKVRGWGPGTSDVSTALYDVAGRTYQLTATLSL